MARQPTKVVYDLGTDGYGRKLELVVEGDKLALHRHAYNQRDEDVWLELHPLQAAELCEVLKS